MSIYVGDKPLVDAFIGDKQVKQVYRGDDLVWPTGIELPEIGDPFYDGFFAGVIDTTRPGSIILNDAYQTGERYALVVSDISLENASLQWRTANADVPAAKTRWNGLAAQRALASSTFPAFQYCAGLAYDPQDGGSEWYLPAMDEFEAVYRNLKLDNAANYLTARTGHDFPGGTQEQGHNPSSDPVGVPYTAGDPAQTTVAAFQAGGPQALKEAYHWTATWYGASFAWLQRPSDGQQASYGQIFTSRVRPVRRVILL